jgi:hypothetical protein
MERYRPQSEERKRRLNSKRGDETDRNMIGVILVKQALENFDAARLALYEARDEFISALNDPKIPASIRAEYWRFWRAGGCCAGQWKDWLTGHQSKERVPLKRGLRLIIKNTTPRRKLDRVPPEAA